MQKKLLPVKKFFEHPLVARAKSFVTKKNAILIFILLLGVVTINILINRSVKKPASVVKEKVGQKVATFIAEGKVLDKNQQPIEGAFVSIEGKSAVTNKDGIWKIELSAKPDENILVLANGYEKLSKTYSQNETIAIQESSKTSATISITDNENKPVSGAFVLYLDANSYKPKQVQKTDGNGQVSFSNVSKDKGGFLVIMDNHKPGWVVAGLNDKDKLTIRLEKPDQTAVNIPQASSSSQMQDTEKNINIFYDPSLKDKNKVKYSVVFKMNQDKLYEELKGISSFNNNQSLNNLSIFPSDSRQSLITIGKINTLDKEQLDSQIITFGNSLNDNKIVSSIPLSVVLTKEYLLSIMNKNNIISTILKLYSDEQANRETNVVFKTEDVRTDKNVETPHDASYLSYAVLSAKPGEGDYYRYESSYCLENFDVPLYKPHGRVVLDNRYYGDRNVYCEYNIERDKSEVVGEGKIKVVTNSIIGWYKKAMEANGWIVIPDKDILDLTFFPRSDYIPAEFKKCKYGDADMKDAIDLFVFEGIIPERYDIFKDEIVFKLLMVHKRFTSRNRAALEEYGCPIDTPTPTPTSMPTPTAKPFSVSTNIPKTGCFDTDGGEEAGIQAGVRKGFDNPLVKGRVYVNGKDYAIVDGKKIVNEDRCVGGWVKEYRCSESYSGKLSWASPYTSYCPVPNTSCMDGACVPMPPSPAPKILTTKCSNSYGGMCIDCDEPPPGFTSCRGNSIPSCPKNDTCTYYKYFQFNPNTFEWEFK